MAQEYTSKYPMVLAQFIYFSLHRYVAIVISTSEKRNENRTGGAIMVTIHMLRAMSVPILAAVLLSTPVWADVDYRSVVPPIQGDQPVTLHEDQRHGAQSTPTYRGGLSADSLKEGDLNLKSLGRGRDGSRAIANPHATFNGIRPDELQEHDARGSGIPLWRW
jgi:hypothetical protein